VAGAAGEWRGEGVPGRGVRAGRAGLVLCLGNDLRADDGVAWRVADLLEAAPPPGWVVRRSAAAGLYLLDELAGFDRAIIVDAVRTGARAAGSVFALPVEALAGPEGPAPHAIGLRTVLGVARRCGLEVPQRLDVVAIEAGDVDTIRVGLTPPVAAAVPRAVRLVRALAGGLEEDEAGSLDTIPEGEP
jgi:hydrogenase maturation protease